MATKNLQNESQFFSENISSGVPFQVFEIFLQTEEFFPGEVIMGKVLVLADRKVETEGIYLKFEGKARAKWEKRKAHLCGLKEAEFVEGKRIYFANVFRYDECTIPSGSSALPFEFQLPSEIPPTIQPGTVLKRMQIKYTIEALIRTSEADYRQTKPVNINGLLNLNKFPELSLPICKIVREVLFESCWSSLGKKLVLSFSISKQGFVPGEKLVANLVIKDFSRCRAQEKKNAITDLLSTVVMSLIQEIELNIGENCRIQRRILSENDIMHVYTKTGKSENKTKPFVERKLCFGLKVPEETMISYENYDQAKDFIRIRHFLRISMEQTSFPYKLIKIQLPIKIGTVWIQEQKAMPILLLASVPLSLKRPESPANMGATANEFLIGANHENENVGELIFPEKEPQPLPLSTAVALLPDIFLDSIEAHANDQINNMYGNFSNEGNLDCGITSSDKANIMNDVTRSLTPSPKPNKTVDKKEGCEATSETST